MDRRCSCCGRRWRALADGQHRDRT
jgi:hypothetical protein